MQKIIYTNSRGESVTLGTKRPYILSSIDGTGGIETDIQMQKSPYQDGNTHIDTLLESRSLNFDVTIVASDNKRLNEHRRKLSSVFNPKLRGELKYIRGNAEKSIECVVDLAPVFVEGKENNGATFQRCTLSLVAPNPYWQSDRIDEEPTFEPLFTFPFEGEFEMGLQRDERIIVNDGDAPAPLHIEFYGPAVNPVITNETTGEFIKVNRTLNEGEFMRIDTTDGMKKVEFVSPDGDITNVFGWIDLESSFFKLVTGENQITYSADSDIQGAVVNISYKKLYVGV